MTIAIEEIEVPKYPNGRINWEQLIRNYARDNDQSFGDAMRYLTKRDRVETAVSLLGVANEAEHVKISLLADELSAFMESKGCTPPSKWCSADVYVRGNIPKEGNEMPMKMTRDEYLEQRRAGKTRAQIAREQGITQSAMTARWLEKWGIRDSAVEAVEMDKSGIASATNEVSKTVYATKDSSMASTSDFSAPTEPNVGSCAQPVDKSVDKQERRERKVSISIALSDAIMRAAVQDLIDEVHETAVEKGWYENEVQLPVQLALIHSEVSEALEADRKQRGPEKVAEELADVVIRVMDTAAAHKLDLTTALFAKMELNRGREHRHGGLPY